jgi:hypothetical protein
MNDIELIKKQIKTLRNLYDKSNPVVKEHLSEIKGKYLITEEDSPRDIEKYNVAQSTGEDIEDSEGIPNDVSQGYRISGGIINIHGDTQKDVELTTEDKTAFQETMDEFVNEVSEMVDFYPINVYPTSVEWSGKVIDQDLEFFYSIGENNGVYINGTMSRVDEEFLTFITNLKKYYQQFRTKWAKVLAVRKKTQTSPDDE